MRCSSCRAPLPCSACRAQSVPRGAGRQPAGRPDLAGSGSCRADGLSYGLGEPGPRRWRSCRSQTKLGAGRPSPLMCSNLQRPTATPRRSDTPPALRPLTVRPDRTDRRPPQRADFIIRRWLPAGRYSNEVDSPRKRTNCEPFGRQLAGDVLSEQELLAVGWRRCVRTRVFAADCQWEVVAVISETRSA